MQGISRKIMKILICTANQESMSSFSAEIVQQYLQDAACANFAKEKSKSTSGKYGKQYDNVLTRQYQLHPGADELTCPCQRS